MRPLYKDHPDALFVRDSSNTGLWYDKFCDRWLPPWDLGTHKQEWIKTVTGLTGNERLITEALARASDLIVAANGELCIYRTDGPFVTGLGREHPVENGFSWHHTLGTAYVPGSSVKGLVRAWATDHLKPSEEKGTVNRIFGPRDPTGSRVGTVVFLDALPAAAVLLKVDVMTPHYAPYYSDESGSIPPADWHDPQPIPFLVVAPQQSFLFGVLPRKSGDPQYRSDCEKAAGWLKDAIEWIGAGAKTAVGYGRFVRDAKKEGQIKAQIARRRDELRKQREVERALSGLSPVAAEFMKGVIEHKWETDKEAFTAMGLVEGWLDRLEADPQRDALEKLEKLVRAHFPLGLLDNPDRVSGKKQRPVFKERQRSIGHRLNRLLATDR